MWLNSAPFENSSLILHKISLLKTCIKKKKDENTTNKKPYFPENWDILSHYCFFFSNIGVNIVIRFMLLKLFFELFFYHNSPPSFPPLPYIICGISFPSPVSQIYIWVTFYFWNFELSLLLLLLLDIYQIITFCLLTFFLSKFFFELLLFQSPPPSFPSLLTPHHLSHFVSHFYTPRSSLIWVWSKLCYSNEKKIYFMLYLIEFLFVHFLKQFSGFWLTNKII